MPNEKRDLDFLIQEKCKQRPDDSEQMTSEDTGGGADLGYSDVWLAGPASAASADQDDLDLIRHEVEQAHAADAGDVADLFAAGTDPQSDFTLEQENAPRSWSDVPSYEHELSRHADSDLSEEAPPASDLDGFALFEADSDDTPVLDLQTAMASLGNALKAQDEPQPPMSDAPEADDAAQETIDGTALDPDLFAQAAETPQIAADEVEPEPQPLREAAFRISDDKAEHVLHPDDSAGDAPAPEAVTAATPGAEVKPEPISEGPEAAGARSSDSDLKTVTQEKESFSLALALASLFEDNRLSGLDLGNSAIKYVQLVKGSRTLSLLNCGNYVVSKPEPGPDEDEEQLDPVAATLRRSLNLKQFKDTLTTTAISGLEVIYKNVSLPKMRKAELQKAVPWACRKDLPFPLEKTAFEFRILQSMSAESEGQAHAFVVAAQKELISKHLKTLATICLTPEKIAPVPAALWRLFRFCHKKNSDACYGIIDLGSRSSHIVFVNNGELQFAREISTGSDDFTRALTGTLFVEGEEIKLSKKQAERLKRRVGIPGKLKQPEVVDGLPLIEVSAMLGQVLDRLIRDIRRTIDFYKERFHVDGIKKIYITGGGALMPNLDTSLAQELNTDVEVLNPFEFISLRKFHNGEQIKQAGPRFAVATGLALDKSRDLNLLPADLKKSHTFRYLKRLFKYLLLILVLAMVFLSQDITRQFRAAQQEFQRVFMSYQQNAPWRERFQQLQHELQQLQGIRSQYSSLDKVNLDPVVQMKLVSQLIPAQVTLTSLRTTRQQRQDEQSKETFVQQVLTLNGIAFKHNSAEGMNLAKFLLGLEKSGYFQSVQLRTQSMQDDGAIQFTIECEL